MDMHGSLSAGDACYIGEHNGTYPNGTLGAGTFAFGHYVPTMVEKSTCQMANDPWMGSAKYGLWTTYFLVAVFALAAVVNGLKRLEVLSRNAALPSPFVVPTRLQAFIRALDQPRLSRFVPPLGTSLVVLAFTVFSFAVCFGIRPYYRPPNFGSSPLGLRSEWIATALIVWIFATAMKRNALAWLTGLTFHRLMSLHKTLPWLCLFFSAVHTGAMIVRAHAQQPWAVTWRTNSAYGWSAWAALASLFWLCALSLGPVRRLSHEFFYLMHVVAAVVFLGTCYHHFARLLGSWAYLHASVVVLGVAFLHRLGAVAFFSHLFTRHDVATVETLGDGAVAVNVEVKSDMRWTAGQHVFVRFLTLQPWSTHPFTIASLDPASLPSSSDSPTRKMRLVLRPHSGLTARLASLASTANPRALPVLLDGPYGASPSTILQGTDEVIFLAGGTGISFVFPLLDALVRGTELHVVRSVRLVWAVPSAECVGWFADELKETLGAFTRARQLEMAKGESADSLDKLGAGATASTYANRVGPTLREVSVEIYVTRAVDASAGDKGLGSAEQAPLSSVEQVSLQRGDRPDVARIVDETIKGTNDRLAVVSCGPPSLLTTARNTVARAQLAIATGALGRDGKGAEEVSLWEESFEL